MSKVKKIDDDDDYYDDIEEFIRTPFFQTTDFDSYKTKRLTPSQQQTMKKSFSIFTEQINKYIDQNITIKPKIDIFENANDDFKQKFNEEMLDQFKNIFYNNNTTTSFERTTSSNIDKNNGLSNLFTSLLIKDISDKEKYDGVNVKKALTGMLLGTSFAAPDPIISRGGGGDLVPVMPAGPVVSMQPGPVANTQALFNNSPIQQYSMNFENDDQTVISKPVAVVSELPPGADTLVAVEPTDAPVSGTRVAAASPTLLDKLFAASPALSEYNTASVSGRPIAASPALSEYNTASVSGRPIAASPALSEYNTPPSVSTIVAADVPVVEVTPVVTSAPAVTDAVVEAAPTVAGSKVSVTVLDPKVQTLQNVLNSNDLEQQYKIIVKDALKEVIEESKKDTSTNFFNVISCLAVMASVKFKAEIKNLVTGSIAYKDFVDKMKNLFMQLIRTSNENKEVSVKNIEKNIDRLFKITYYQKKQEDVDYDKIKLLTSNYIIVNDDEFAILQNKSIPSITSEINISDNFTPVKLPTIYCGNYYYDDLLKIHYINTKMMAQPKKIITPPDSETETDFSDSETESLPEIKTEKALPPPQDDKLISQLQAEKEKLASDLNLEKQNVEKLQRELNNKLEAEKNALSQLEALKAEKDQLASQLNLEKQKADTNKLSDSEKDKKLVQLQTELNDKLENEKKLQAEKEKLEAEKQLDLQQFQAEKEKLESEKQLALQQFQAEKEKLEAEKQLATQQFQAEKEKLEEQLKSVKSEKDKLDSELNLEKQKALDNKLSESEKDNKLNQLQSDISKLSGELQQEKDDRQLEKVNADKEMERLRTENIAEIARVKSETEAAEKLKADAEIARVKAETEAAEKLKAAEAIERVKAETEAAEKLKADAEIARVKSETEAAEKLKAAEAIERVKAETEAAEKLKAAEAIERVKASEKQKADEASRLSAESEAARLRAESEAARLRAESEAAEKRKSDEAARLRAESEAARLRAESEAAEKRKSDEEAARLKAIEREAKLKEDAEQARKKQEAEAKLKEEEETKAKALALSRELQELRDIDKIKSHIINAVKLESNPLFADIKVSASDGRSKEDEKLNSYIRKLKFLFDIFNTDIMIKIACLLSDKEKLLSLVNTTIIGSEQLLTVDGILNVFFVSTDNYPNIVEVMINKNNHLKATIDRDTKIFKKHIDNDTSKKIFIYTIIKYLQTDINQYIFEYKKFDEMIKFLKFVVDDLFLKLTATYENLRNNSVKLNNLHQELIQEQSICSLYVKYRLDSTSFNPRYEIDNEKDFNLKYNNVDGIFGIDASGNYNRETAKKDIEKSTQNKIENYFFPKFNGLFTDSTESNGQIARKMYNEEKSIIKKIITKNQDLVMVGYGQSGSGKTSTIVYAVITDEQGKVTKTDGVLIEICKLDEFKNHFNKIDIQAYNIYTNHLDSNEDYLKYDTGNYTQKQILIPIDDEINLTKVEFKPDSESGWKSDVASGSKNMGEIIDTIFNLREIEPTPNNPDSSRSHLICCLTLHKKEEGETGTGLVRKIIICDLAGVENVFRCNNLNEILKFDNSYDKSRKYKKIVPAFDDYYEKQKTKKSDSIFSSFADMEQKDIEKYNSTQNLDGKESDSDLSSSESDFSTDSDDEDDVVGDGNISSDLSDYETSTLSSSDDSLSTSSSDLSDEDDDDSLSTSSSDLSDEDDDEDDDGASEEILSRLIDDKVFDGAVIDGSVKDKEFLKGCLNVKLKTVIDKNLANHQQNPVKYAKIDTADKLKKKLDSLYVEGLEGIKINNKRIPMLEYFIKQFDGIKMKEFKEISTRYFLKNPPQPTKKNPKVTEVDFQKQAEKEIEADTEPYKKDALEFENELKEIFKIKKDTKVAFSDLLTKRTIYITEDKLQSYVDQAKEFLNGVFNKKRKIIEKGLVQQNDDFKKQVIEAACLQYRFDMITSNCRFRVSEGIMINHALYRLFTHDLRNLIKYRLFKKNQGILPLMYDVDIPTYCRNIYSKDDYYDVFEKQNADKFDIEKAGTILKIIGKTFGLNLDTVNFGIFTIINLTDTIITEKTKKIVNNPPNPPYFNISNLIYNLPIKHGGMTEDYNINKNTIFSICKTILTTIKNKYDFYNNNIIDKYIEDFEKLDDASDYDTIFTTLIRPLKEYIEMNNATTFIGTLHDTMKISTMTFNKVVPSFNDELYKDREKLLTRGNLRIEISRDNNYKTITNSFGKEKQIVNIDKKGEDLFENK